MGRSNQILDQAEKKTRMMKNLVLFLLMGFALISLSAGNEDENELLETENTDMMELENMETLELAEPEAMPKKKNKKKKNKKNKMKKKKKNKKNKKGTNKKNKKGRNKKNKKGRNKKNKKGRNKKNKKGRNKKGNRKGRSGTRATQDCVDNIDKYLYFLANQANNLKKQIKRADNHKNIAVKKMDKKGVFATPLSAVQDAAGTDLTKPMCGDSLTNAGAVKLKDLLENLTACSDNIKKACNTDMPAAPNKTELDSCGTKAEEYITKMKDNHNKTDLCTAFGDDDTKKKYEAVKACITNNMTGNNMTINKWQTAVTNAKKKCITAFSQCRKQEREVGPTIHTCSRSSTKILKSITGLTTNNNSATTVKNKVNDITSPSGRHNRAVPTDCTGVVDVVKTFHMKLKKNLEADVTSETNDISGIKLPTGECSTNTELKGYVTKLGTIITDLGNKIDILQDQLKTLTGSTASTSQIAAASTASSTVSARKRKAALHKILNEVNMH